MSKEMLINEGGINWTWFTRIRLEPDDTVTILENYRRHNTDEVFTDEEKHAKSHPNYEGSNIWKETKGRIAIEYFVPKLGWKIINNQKYVGDYGKAISSIIVNKSGKSQLVKEEISKEKLYEDIGKIVITTASKLFDESTHGNYSISDYVDDFEGTQEELIVALIKLASK